ncbi:MAG: Bug family tripartite tricarboxylate transporter substrate binding protein [Burkholderiales bacterium]
MNFRASLAVAMFATATSLFAQSYPVKPIRMVIPIPAGSLTDVMGRAVGQGVAAAWGQPVVAENRPGAHGAIGMVECGKGGTEGYTICMTDGNILTLNSFAYNKLPYDPVAFAPIIHLAEIEVGMYTKSALPVKNVKEFLDHARARPGQVAWGSAGAGSTMHLYMEWFQTKTGIRFNHIPYKGPAELTLAIASGEVDVTNIAPSSVAAHVKAGKVTPLAVVVGKRRSSFAGDTPTLASQGFELDFRNWLALVAPPGTNNEAVRRWNTEANRLLNDSGFVSKVMGAQAMIATGGTPEDLAATIQEKRKVAAELTKIANLKYD